MFLQLDMTWHFLEIAMMCLVLVVFLTKLISMLLAPPLDLSDDLSTHELIL